MAAQFYFIFVVFSESDAQLDGELNYLVLLLHLR